MLFLPTYLYLGYFIYFHITYRACHVYKYAWTNYNILNQQDTFEASNRGFQRWYTYFTWLFRYSKTMKESTLGRLSDCPFSNPSSNLLLIITEHINN